MLDLRITLEACNPARRCSRQYRVEAGTDLFGVWVVEITCVTIRKRSQVLDFTGVTPRFRIVTTAASAPPGDRGAISFAMKGMPGTWPRASSSVGPAPRRLGVAYRIRERTDPAGVGRGGLVKTLNFP